MIIKYNNNKYIYDDIKGDTVNPWDTIWQSYASLTHPSSDVG